MKKTISILTCGVFFSTAAFSEQICKTLTMGEEGKGEPTKVTLEDSPDLKCGVFTIPALEKGDYTVACHITPEDNVDKPMLFKISSSIMPVHSEPENFVMDKPLQVKGEASFKMHYRAKDNVVEKVSYIDMSASRNNGKDNATVISVACSYEKEGVKKTAETQKTAATPAMAPVKPVQKTGS